MIYSIEINVSSKRFNNQEYYFWCIFKLENEKRMNYGHGWSESIEIAASDAYSFYIANIHGENIN